MGQITSNGEPARIPLRPDLVNELTGWPEASGPLAGHPLPRPAGTCKNREMKPHTVGILCRHQQGDIRCPLASSILGQESELNRDDSEGLEF